MTAVEWRDIPGFEGCYQASSDGRVRSLPRSYIAKNGTPSSVRGRVLRPGAGKSYRYYSVAIRANADDRAKSWKVHQLVARAFHGLPPFPAAVVCHKDGDSTNNHADNLRWGTNGDNSMDTLAHGTHKMAQRDACGAGHEYTPETTRRRRTASGRPGARVCLRCKRGYQRRYCERLQAVS